MKYRKYVPILEMVQDAKDDPAKTIALKRVIAMELAARELDIRYISSEELIEALNWGKFTVK